MKLKCLVTFMVLFTVAPALSNTPELCRKYVFKLPWSNGGWWIPYDYFKVDRVGAIYKAYNKVLENTVGIYPVPNFSNGHM